MSLRPPWSVWSTEEQDHSTGLHLTVWQYLLWRPTGRRHSRSQGSGCSVCLAHGWKSASSPSRGHSPWVAVRKYHSSLGTHFLCCEWQEEEEAGSMSTWLQLWLDSHCHLSLWISTFPPGLQSWGDKCQTWKDMGMRWWGLADRAMSAFGKLLYQCQNQRQRARRRLGLAGWHFRCGFIQMKCTLAFPVYLCKPLFFLYFEVYRGW